MKKNIQRLIPSSRENLAHRSRQPRDRQAPTAKSAIRHEQENNASKNPPARGGRFLEMRQSTTGGDQAGVPGWILPRPSVNVVAHGTHDSEILRTASGRGAIGPQSL